MLLVMNSGPGINGKIRIVVYMFTLFLSAAAADSLASFNAGITRDMHWGSQHG